MGRDIRGKLNYLNKIKILEHAIFQGSELVEITSQSKEFLALLYEGLASSCKERGILENSIRKVVPELEGGLLIYRDRLGNSYLHLTDIDSTQMKLMKSNGEAVTFRKLKPFKLIEKKIMVGRILA